ncbi:MAG: saccharopine dehydrogenase family protein [Vicinamibacterales bacterium]
MRILLLGTGMQGRAALHDLARSTAVSNVVAADRDLPGLQAFVHARAYGDKVVCAALDAADRGAVDRLMADGVDVVIDLLPVPFIGTVAASAVAHRVHLINTFYVTPELAALARDAEARGVSLLPELGMDPGLDLLMLGDMVRQLDEVTEILSYGAGIPEPAAATNAIRYKVSWTFEGVLRSYLRPARLVRDGQPVELSDRVQFQPQHVHHVEVAGVGRLEAFPNGDALAYARQLGLDDRRLRRAGRYAMRYPGHCAFWATMVDLHLLDDDAVVVEGAAVNRRKFLAAALEPQLQYGPGERDLAIIRVEVAGRRGGVPVRLVREVIDRRDLESGLTAMSRTVGFTASVGAQFLASGAVTKRGLLSPVTDLPYDAFVAALASRGIVITSREERDSAS